MPTSTLARAALGTLKWLLIIAVILLAASFFTGYRTRSRV